MPLTRKQMFLLLETIDRGLERIAGEIHAWRKDYDRDFQERVILAFREDRLRNKKKKK